MSPSVSIFIQDEKNQPARLGKIFDELGFLQTAIFTPEHDLSYFDVLSPDLLVVMGGPSRCL